MNSKEAVLRFFPQARCKRITTHLESGVSVYDYVVNTGVDELGAFSGYSAKDAWDRVSIWLIHNGEEFFQHATTRPYPNAAPNGICKAWWFPEDWDDDLKAF